MSALSGTSVQSTQLYILNEIVRFNSSLIFPITAAFIRHYKKCEPEKVTAYAFCTAGMAGDRIENQLGEIISWVLVLPHIP